MLARSNEVLYSDMSSYSWLITALARSESQTQRVRARATLTDSQSHHCQRHRFHGLHAACASTREWPSVFPEPRRSKLFSSKNSRRECKTASHQSVFLAGRPALSRVQFWFISV